MMSEKGGGGGRGGGGGSNEGKGDQELSGIPEKWSTMVQRLKEILDRRFTEHEIYVTLKECNMDPDDTVTRLLSQDPFHEVKSKREKKKENKDTTETRSRGLANTNNRGIRISTDHYAGSSNLYSTTESSISHGKPSYKKENSSHTHAPSSSFVYGLEVNGLNWRPSSHSEVVAMENKASMLGAGEGTTSSSQLFSGCQSAWAGVTGQVSMADIVKMGGQPQGKASATQNILVQAASHQKNVQENIDTSQYHASQESEMHSESGITYQNGPSNDGWDWTDPPSAVSFSTVMKSPAESELYSDPSNLHQDGSSQHITSGLDVVQGAEDGPVETINANHIGPASISGRCRQDHDSRHPSVFDNSGLYNEASTYQSHKSTFEHNEAEGGISSVSTHVQQLNLHEDDQGMASEEDNPSVVIPDHLQLHTPDCFHLSFGSFGSRTLKGNTDEASALIDVSIAGHSESRKSEYYEDGPLGSTSDENLIQRNGASAVNYDTRISQAEVLRLENPQNPQLNEYAFPSSIPAFPYESNLQSNTEFTHQQTSSPDVSTLSGIMQAFSNSLSSTSMPSTVQTVREDPPYSQFRIAQSMPTNYSNIISSMTSPSISISEVLRMGSNSTTLPDPQSLPGGGATAGPSSLQQHLNVHSYSPRNHPLGQYANMMGYPSLLQSYAYMPSAFQQALAGNSTHHQSLAAALPQYNKSVSVSSLPQSGYGFINATNIPTGRNFPLNQQASTPSRTTIGYEDLISSRFKDNNNNHLISLQQNENSGMWVPGSGSRTMHGFPASTYYSLQGQGQLGGGGFREAQQHLLQHQSTQQHFGGGQGDPNFYQQQSLRDPSLGSSQQGPQLKQSKQIWQKDY